MTKLKIENPAILAHHAQAYICKKTTEGTIKPPFTCDVIIVLGGNILKSGDCYTTTPYEKGTKKSFGAQGRVITAAFLYHLGVTDCLILSTGKTDPEDKDAPSEASVMKVELTAYSVPEICIHLEERSQTTEGNARELVKLFTTERFKEQRTIGVITSSWHIRRTGAFLQKEGLHAEGRKIKLISSDTMISRYLPEFRKDIYRLYHRQEMKYRIQDELNGYNALKDGTYRSRKLGKLWKDTNISDKVVQPD